jgi:NADH:ubiquinone oxidoreductase subunit 2 (subunit N)
MKRLLNISGIVATGFLLLSLIINVIGFLWKAPNEGLVHNLFRYSLTATVVFGSIWVFLIVYRETKEN